MKAIFSLQFLLMAIGIGYQLDVSELGLDVA